MIDILAIEDNPIHQEFLYVAIQELGYKLIGVADNAKDAMALLFATRPDVVLMDIELNGSQDGIALAGQINRLKPTPIIFTTAMKDRQTIDRAKATEPYAYLIKPFEQESLQAALEMAIYRFAADQERKNADSQIIPDWNAGIALQQYLFIKRGSMIDKVAFEDILLVEVVKDRYCAVVTASEEYLVRSALKEIGIKLPLKDFIQVHRAAIVRASAIAQVDGTGAFLVVNGREVSIGKTYRDKILKHLGAGEK